VEIIACGEIGVTESHFMTVAEASFAIRAKALSPLELTKSFVNRIKALDGQLDSCLMVLEETARAMAVLEG
jgi:Asp-tRNA(Asn)/Glu-tRNA(Gln) amidotransferase A subunit family amidase